MTRLKEWLPVAVVLAALFALVWITGSLTAALAAFIGVAVVLAFERWRKR